jgi:multiple sugar transport system substrate-binding protein
MFRRRAIAPIAAACLAVSVVGCSAGGEGNKAAGEQPQAAPKIEVPSGPITLKVGSTRTPQALEEVTRTVKAKYPNVTLEFMPAYKTDVKVINELVTSGNLPDILDVATTHIPILLDFDLPIDLEPLLKKYNFNLNSIDPGALTDIRSYNGKQVMVPTNLTPPTALFYNKDLFDRFGVSYPKVGNTWEDLMEPARKLSRSEGGVNYLGLIPATNANYHVKQRSLPYVDAKTGKSTFATDNGWKLMFEHWKSIIDIPGNYPAGTKFTSGTSYFFQDKRLALYPNYLYFLQEKILKDSVASGLNFGVTTWPAFKDAPNVTFGSFSGGMMITKSNKYPDFSLQLIMTMVSDEGQIDFAKNGMTPSVSKPELRTHIFEGNPAIDVVPKDVFNAIVSMKEPKPVFRSKFDPDGLTVLTKYMHEYLENKTDLNTALRKADEEFNKIMEDNSRK